MDENLLKALEKLEKSFLLWDEDTLKVFVETVMKKWEKGGGIMKTKKDINKGLCSTCIRDKDCGYPRKFPVYACDDFTLGKTNGGIGKERWSAKE